MGMCTQYFRHTANRFIRYIGYNRMEREETARQRQLGRQYRFYFLLSGLFTLSSIVFKFVEDGYAKTFLSMISVYCATMLSIKSTQATMEKCAQNPSGNIHSNKIMLEMAWSCYQFFPGSFVSLLIYSYYVVSSPLLNPRSYTYQQLYHNVYENIIEKKPTTICRSFWEVEGRFTGFFCLTYFLYLVPMIIKKTKFPFVLVSYLDMLFRISTPGFLGMSIMSAYVWLLPPDFDLCDGSFFDNLSKPEKLEYLARLKLLSSDGPAYWQPSGYHILPAILYFYLPVYLLVRSTMVTKSMPVFLCGWLISCRWRLLFYIFYLCPVLKSSLAIQLI